MNAAALSPDAARLKAVRASLEAISPAAWLRAQDENGPLIEARADFGEIVVLARFSEHASVDEVAFAADAPDTVRFLLRLLDEAFARIRTLRPEAPRAAAGEPAAREAKNFATECAMKCQDARFKVYLEEKHGLERPLTDSKVAQRVRSILGVQSRNELNNGGEASERWKALRADFAAWLKAGK
ncbi:hypothetical protein P9279_22015 [Mesorhizobium sp. WSM4962]|uniref:hypothetical protein n=1 Tax=Mesorhizobium sp. WSM4962 TaxID=3038548 RepID=UPI002417E84B|nr:hypothetical protein [Mesorhizobium sp. WSM4962]MDG4903189.1 hypothetical protein [Mesorhizobium sp. WSM4962]